MSSSPTSPALAKPVSRQELLLELLDGITDPRARRGRRHTARALIAVVIAAMLTNARGWTAIAEWAQDAGKRRLARLGMVGRAADEATFRRLFARMDSGVLERVLAAWTVTRAARISGRRVYAIDGKSLRGARKKGAGKAFLVAALDCLTGTVAGQIAIGGKDSEITAARTLLGMLDVAGAVITMDALHTQHETARLIRAAGAHFVFTVKPNQKTLYQLLKTLPWTKIPATSSTRRGHGRTTTRTIKVLDAPAWIEFTAAVQVAQLRRTVTKNGKRTVEIVYLITSANARTAPPATLAGWIRSQWQIENRLHWVKDVTLGEDACQITTGNAPQNISALRNLVIAILRHDGWDNPAAATRHQARDLNRPIHTLLQA